MKEIICNVWDILDENSAICILTNNMILSNGENVMGGGIAKEACDRNPGLSLIVGNAIKNNRYMLGYDKLTDAIMLRFPTKNMPWENSDYELIANSLNRLKESALDHPDIKYYLPRPGCGLGGLDWEDVKELCEVILKNLDNIYIVSK